MVELVEYIIKQFTSEPKSVKVTQEEKDDKIVIYVRVSQGDMGKVIGKQGRIAKAIRSIVKAASSNDSKKYFVEIVDNEA